MNENKKKRYKGGGSKVKHAEAGQKGRSLQDCALNEWKDLRPALEVGAAEKRCVTAMELVSDEKITVNLKIINPRTMEEEDLTTANVNKLMMYELIDLARQRDLAIQRVARRDAAAPENGVGENDPEGSALSESSHNEDAVETGNAAVEPQAAPDDHVPDDMDDDFDDEIDDALANNEIFESSKALITNKYKEEAKTLREENQKLVVDRQKVIRNFHEAFIKEKNESLYNRYHQKHGSSSKQTSVIEYVKQVKKLLFNLDNKVGFEKEREVKSIFNNWKQKKIYNIEQIVVEVKKLKEYNEDCADLGCNNEKCDDENGIIYLCEKMSGKLEAVGSETRAKIRDRRASLMMQKPSKKGKRSKGFTPSYQKSLKTRLATLAR